MCCPARTSLPAESMALAEQLLHARGPRPHGAAPIDLISIQSQVVYGHAGNSAAVEPLRALGLRVAEIPTTLLSNAPVYATTRGRTLPADWFADLLRGARERGLPGRARMLLSGYLATASNGEAFAHWLEAVLPSCPQLQFCLDPVLGDSHTGLYVEPGLPELVRERLLPLAWLLPLNVFELGLLCGHPCGSEHDCLAAARELLHAGPQWVVVHGIPQGADVLTTLAVSAQASYRIVSPRLPIDVTGTGDVLAALLVGFLLRGEIFPHALQRCVAGVHGALEATLQAQYEELEVQMAAPAALAATGDRFVAVEIA